MSITYIFFRYFYNYSIYYAAVINNVYFINLLFPSVYC